MAAALGDGDGSECEAAMQQQQLSPDGLELARRHAGTYHFKILVPSVAAGAIIGKGGETIAQLQKETGTRVKMSKATDFYPGTRERVCLLTGSIEGILRMHDFIMERIKEKPDPNAKLAIDFDHKQPAEREKQVKILVPNSTVGMIMGKGGSYIKQIKEKSCAYVQISQKSKDHALIERCITIIGEMENNKVACSMILAKIVQDPQSGNCLNVSYADVTGPIANFNPTGSPFANPNSVGKGSMNNSSTSYSSNDSLNSLNTHTATSSFQGGHHPQTSTPHTGLMSFAGLNAAPPSIPPNVNQVIERFKTMLRGSGYTEQAVTEIGAAMNTLASYNIPSYNFLTLAMNGGGGGAGINGGPPVMSGLGMQQQQQQPAQMYSSGMDPSAGDPANNIFSSSIGNLGNGVSGLGLGPGYASPPAAATASRGGGDRYVSPGDGYEPFRRGSPTLASPGAAALPVNNNSFGLGTGLAGSGDDGSSQDGISKMDVEVGENIVGAILGVGGKALVEIQRFSGANIQISKKGIFAPGTRNRIVSITGPAHSVNTARYLIERSIAEEEEKRAQQNSMGILH